MLGVSLRNEQDKKTRRPNMERGGEWEAPPQALEKLDLTWFVDGFSDCAPYGNDSVFPSRTMAADSLPR